MFINPFYFVSSSLSNWFKKQPLDHVYIKLLYVKIVAVAYSSV